MKEGLSLILIYSLNEHGYSLCKYESPFEYIKAIASFLLEHYPFLKSKYCKCWFVHGSTSKVNVAYLECGMCLYPWIIVFILYKTTPVWFLLNLFSAMRYVFAGTSNCDVIHGVLYSCLRGLFGISVIGILVCIFSCMLVYQLQRYLYNKNCFIYFYEITFHFYLISWRLGRLYIILNG